MKLANRLLVYALLLGLFVSGLLHVQNHFIDYPVYELAARRVIDGKISELYDVARTSPGGYYYSYFFALAFTPFVLLGPVAGKVLFFLTFFSAYLKIISFSVKMAAGPESSNYGWGFLATALLTLYSVNDAFMDANIGILLLVLSIFAFELRSRRPMLAGVLLAIAIVFKIYPIVVLGYFVWEKRFRLVTASVLTGVALYLVLPILIYGSSQGMTLLSNHWQVVGHFGDHWSFDSTKFQNFPSSFIRFTEIFGLSRRTGFHFSVVIVAVATILFYLKSFLVTVEHQDFKRRMFFLCLALVPIGVPVSWYNMGLFYTPLIAWLVFQALDKKDWAAGLAILFFTATYCLTTPDLVGLDLNHRAEAASVPFLGAFVITLEFARRIRRDYREYFFG